MKKLLFLSLTLFCLDGALQAGDPDANAIPKKLINKLNETMAYIRDAINRNEERICPGISEEECLEEVTKDLFYRHILVFPDHKHSITKKILQSQAERIEKRFSNLSCKEIAQGQGSETCNWSDVACRESQTSSIIDAIFTGSSVFMNKYYDSKRFVELCKDHYKDDENKASECTSIADSIKENLATWNNYYTRLVECTSE
ncbi:hypothetical protein KJZ61_00970 [Candidatus Dependentiae bacterium]|nr:hypothetical protein [Candidatus Dependentiae bacterium]